MHILYTGHAYEMNSDNPL